MASAARTFTFRLTAEGVDKIRKDLESIGPAGVQAFQKIQSAAPQFEDAFARAQRQVDAAARSIATANENVPKGFARVGAAAEALETSTKRATRGLNDVRGTLELLGPLAGEAGGQFGGLVRMVGNVGDAFGVLSAVFSKNPMALAITAAGLLGAALVGVTVKTYDAAEAQKKYEAALKAQDEILRSTTEKNELSAAAKKEEATQAALVSLKIEQENLARLERLRLRQKEAELDAGMAAGPGVGRSGSRDTEAEIVAAHSRIAQVRGRMAQVEEKTEEQLRDEREKKERDRQEAIVQFETARAEESVRLSEEEAAARVKVDEAARVKREKIAADYSSSIAKQAEEDAKVQQEAAEATNRFLVAEAERRNNEVFGAGAMKAAQDYWDGLAQHGRRAQQFVANSVLRPMEDSLARFLATGKGKFSDFFDSLKLGIARLAAQDLIGGLGSALGLGSGGGSAIGAGISAAGSFLSGLFFAEGGRPRVGQWAIVGEEGPELVKFDSAAQVYSNRDSKAMLQQAQAMGRGGDTILAHINPREAQLLQALGGSGTINPHTGLREYTDQGQGDGPDPSSDTSGAAAASAPGGVGPGAGKENDGFGWDSFGDPLDFQGPGYKGSPISPGGLATRAFRDEDNKVVEAYSRYGVNVASAISRGQAPGFFDYVSDFLGIGNPGGFLGSKSVGVLGSIALALAGLPMFAAALGNIGLGFGRAALSGGTARGTGIGGMAYDIGVLGKTPLDVFGPVVDKIDRAFGYSGPSRGMFGVGDLDPGRALGSASATISAALSQSGASRLGGTLGASVSGLRDGLGGPWADVVATGQNVMASARRFHQGGRFTIGGPAGSEQPVFFVGQSGEEVEVRRRGQTADVSNEALARVLAAGFEMLATEMRALRGEMAALTRRMTVAA